MSSLIATRPSRLAAAARGIGAGLVGALAMTLTMLLLRVLVGIPTAAELIGDRAAALMPLDLFFSFLSLFGGYNGAKQFGAGATLAGQLAAGAAGGALLALLVDRRDGHQDWPVLRVVIGLAAGAWLLLVILLWPNLGTSYVGLPPSSARIVTAIGLGGAIAVYVVVTLAVHRFLQPRASADADTGRRSLLVGGAGLGLAVASGGLLKHLFDRATFSYDGTQYIGQDLVPITPNDRFYLVTKNLIDPTVDAATWRLEVDGHVERPMTYDLAAVQALASLEQETTLMCISNPIAWGLMSNAIWTGVPMATVLEAAGVRDGAVEVLAHAADGYTDTFSIEKAMDPTTLVAYGMNGEPLPQRHGFPVRLIVPGMYGEKNVKWVTRLEIVDHDAKGFYEQQGWGPNFEIPNRSRIDGPDLSRAVRAGTLVGLTGIALGGNRGVSAVEVSTDDGATWQPAEITYPGTRLSWAFWRFDWRPASAGEYGVVVRMTDGDGSLQTAEERGTAPQGATGYHRVTATVT